MLGKSNGGGGEWRLAGQSQSWFCEPPALYSSSGINVAPPSENIDFMIFALSVKAS